MWKFMIVPDPDQMGVTEDKMFFARNEKEKAQMVSKLACRVGENNVCVYEIKELHKMVKKPEFARYAVNDNGEILPL